MSTLDAIAENRAAALEFETNALEAEKLASKVADMKADLARFEAQERALAAHGDEHVEIALEQYVPKYHTTIAFQPLKSILSGNELAAKSAEKAEYIRGEIAKAEAEIERLLHGEVSRSKKR